MIGYGAAHAPRNAFADTRDVTNTTGSAATISVTYQADAGERFLLMGGNLTNGDLVSNAASASLTDASETFRVVMAGSGGLGAGSKMEYPGSESGEDNFRALGGNMLLHSGMLVDVRLASVADTQDGKFQILAFTDQDAITVTETVA